MVFVVASFSDDRLEAAFADALNCPSAAERQQLLAQLAIQDAALAREVESLWAARSEIGERLESPAAISFAHLLTTRHDGAGVIESDLATLLAEVQPQAESADLGLLRGYVVQECVAVGNTGFVFRARDPNLNRQVAMKVLAPSIARDDARRREFLNEARITSRIRHENVVTIYHVSADDADGAVVFYVMEWIAGLSLQTWLERSPPPSRQEALSMVDQIAGGLSKIHAQGIVHRDLKPGNILREDSTGRMVILDFGLAFEGGLDTDVESLAGTPLFMSPEQLRGEPITSSSDLFSLGAIAYWIVHQRHPFAGVTLAQVMSRIMRGELDCPEVGAAFPGALSRVFAKSLAADPMGRYATAEAFLADIRAVLDPGHDLFAAQSLSPQGSPSAREGLCFPAAKSVGHRLGGLWWMLGIVLLAAIGWGVIGARWKTPTVDERSGHEAMPATFGFQDQDTYVNFLGMTFRRVPAVADIDAWPPFPEHPELTARLDWRHLDRDRYLGTHEVTRREFARIMGPDAKLAATTPAEQEDLPVVGITFDEAVAACQKLTERDPDGREYYIPGEIEMTYAAYGHDLLSRGLTPAALQARLPQATDAVVAVTQTEPSSLGLYGLRGNVWEWTDAVVRKPPVWEGVVSYRDSGELPAEENRLLFGGGARDFFVHAFDMNCGMNDFLETADNAFAHTEPDAVTKYLCPAKLDQPLRLVYHYSFATPVRDAYLHALLGLFVELSEYEVRVRRGIQRGSESIVGDWQSVRIYRGEFHAAPVEMDLTPFLAEATEVWIEYRLLADVGPRHYTQFARTSPQLKLPNVCRFEARLQPANDTVRKQVAMPRSLASPFVGFRMAMCDKVRRASGAAAPITP
jgi:predicted Ser/Thr protein kinase